MMHVLQNNTLSLAAAKPILLPFRNKFSPGLRTLSAVFRERSSGRTSASRCLDRPRGTGLQRRIARFAGNAAHRAVARSNSCMPETQGIIAFGRELTAIILAGAGSHCCVTGIFPSLAVFPPSFCRHFDRLTTGASQKAPPENRSAARLRSPILRSRSSTSTSAATGKSTRLSPSPAATDGEWCRRVFLDVLGRIPTIDELERFLSEPARAQIAVGRSSARQRLRRRICPQLDDVVDQHPDRPQRRDRRNSLVNRQGSGTGSATASRQHALRPSGA